MDRMCQTSRKRNDKDEIAVSVQKIYISNKGKKAENGTENSSRIKAGCYLQKAGKVKGKRLLKRTSRGIR